MAINWKQLRLILALIRLQQKVRIGDQMSAINKPGEYVYMRTREGKRTSENWIEDLKCMLLS